MNGSAAGNRASVTRGGTRASARPGFIDGADEVNKDGRSRNRPQQNAHLVDLTQGTLELERAGLLASKQVDLEQVVDKHDDLVGLLLLLHYYGYSIFFSPIRSGSYSTWRTLP